MADTLTEVGRDWSSYYRGTLARRFAAGLATLGSPVAEDVLARHRAEVTDPLTATVGGTTWSVAPAPTQGSALLAVLAAGSDRLAAARAAELARDAELGDPRTPSAGT